LRSHGRFWHNKHILDRGGHYEAASEPEIYCEHRAALPQNDTEDNDHESNDARSHHQLET
jgi:hypothetical protein